MGARGSLNRWTSCGRRGDRTLGWGAIIGLRDRLQAMVEQIIVTLGIKRALAKNSGSNTTTAQCSRGPTLLALTTLEAPVFGPHGVAGGRDA